MRGHRIFILSTLLLGLISMNLVGQSIPLPEKMGLINDYSAQLGNAHRDELKHFTSRLSNETELQTYLLMTLLDPFSNINKFSDAIWEKWELPNTNTLLLIFVREQGIWYFHWVASSDMESIVSDLSSTTKIFDRTKQLVRDGQIGNAAVEALEQITLNFAGPEIEVVPLRDSLELQPDESDPEVINGDFDFSNFSTESISSQEVEQDSTLWYAIGGVGGSLILFLIIRTAFMMSCPQCGGRLERRDAPINQFSSRRSTSRRSKKTTFCPNCRYQRSAA